MKKERCNQLPGWSKLILWISVSLTIIGTASAQEENITDCDLLAANPSDPEKITSGVGFEELDAGAAIKACKEAVALEPESSRLIFQYGRALDKGEKYADALEQYRKAANLGYAAAQVNLGFMYTKGKGVPVNLSEAMMLYRKAAEQGNSDAQINLGIMYYFGDGVPVDHSEGMKWYRKAAEQGNSNAQYSLGVIYHKGKGAKKDFNQALTWYHKASEQGNVDAQFNLGIMYYHGDGKGVPKDLQKAKEWLEKAAKNGDDKAKASLARVINEQSQQNVRAAEQRVDNQSLASVSGHESTPTTSIDATIVCPPNSSTRFVDNGNGTICDHKTGLMWEKKTSSDGIHNLADPHDVDNKYTWSSTGVAPDGTAFTDFLARLNGIFTGSTTSELFAGYDNWRLPTSKELITLHAPECRRVKKYCTVDPVFVPTAVGLYLSDSGDGDRVWIVNFNSNESGYTDFPGNKTLANDHLRAVRDNRARKKALTQEEIRAMEDEVMQKDEAIKKELAEERKKREERTQKYGHPGPFLKAGSTVCDNYKSMYKAAVIQSTNNPFVEIPYDCSASTVQLLAIRKIDHMAGGIARVLLKGNRNYLYTTDNSIIE